MYVSGGGGRGGVYMKLCKRRRPQRVHEGMLAAAAAECI